MGDTGLIIETKKKSEVVTARPHDGLLVARVHAEPLQSCLTLGDYGLYPATTRCDRATSFNRLLSAPASRAPVVKSPPASAGGLRRGLHPWVGVMPGGGHANPLHLPGESHRQRSLAGYSPRGHKESDVTEALSVHAYPFTEHLLSLKL